MKNDRHILIVTTDTVNPWHNLAMEEYLMGLCKSDSDPDPARQFAAILFLWQNEHTVVIGRNQNAWAECRTGLLEEEGGYLARRSTGGGAVYHDLGNLNFSIILPRSRFDLGQSFQVILDAVRALGIDAVRSGRNDILIEERKFSGNAFRYHRGVALHHGTLMVDTNVEPLERYLNVSKTKLNSKAIKSVRSRVVNLIEVKTDLTIASLSSSVIDAFIAHYANGSDVHRLTTESLKEDEALLKLEARYASWDWRYGRSIDFDLKVETGRHPWGQAELLFRVEQGVVNELVIYSDALDSDFIQTISDSLPGTRFHSENIASHIEAMGTDRNTVGEISQKIIADDIAHVIRDHSF